MDSNSTAGPIKRTNIESFRIKINRQSRTIKLFLASFLQYCLRRGLSSSHLKAGCDNKLIDEAYIYMTAP